MTEQEYFHGGAKVPEEQTDEKYFERGSLFKHLNGEYYMLTRAEGNKLALVGLLTSNIWSTPINPQSSMQITSGEFEGFSSWTDFKYVGKFHDIYQLKGNEQ